jgi:phosphatidyl-myo-inositol alpha-mannosyltransferase
MAEKPKLKIGFVYDDTLDGFDGVAQYVKTLGSWLTYKGHEVRYLVGETKAKDWNGGKIFSLSKNMKVSFNGNQARIPLPAGGKYIKEILASEKFDVLHVQIPYSPFMAQKVIQNAGPGTAIVGTFHVVPANFIALYGSKFLSLIQRKSLKKFNEVFSVSTAAADFAKNSFGINSEIIPNVIEYSRYSKTDQITHFKKPYKILFFGRLVKRKGCRELVLAFANLIKINGDYELVIAGDGPERKKLEALVKEFKIQDKVKFIGFITEKDKPQLLAGADIACFPSLYGESFGIVLLEAMAAGSGIVLGGNNVGYSTVLGDQPKMLVDPINTDEFAKRLNDLMVDKEKANKLHAWQQEEVKRYDVNNVGIKLLERYNSAIDKKEQNRHN